MQLQPPTQPAGGQFAPTGAGDQNGVDDEVEEDAESGLVKALSCVALVAALVVLALQLMAAGQWINSEDNPRKGEWSQLMG